MSAASDKRSEEFLKISGQFKLGALVTESSHPATAKLSDVAKHDVAAALDLLFQVDNDVVAKYREFAESGRAEEIKATLLRSLKEGGRIFFTGCGSTGRLSIQLVSIWRDFWHRRRQRLEDAVNQSSGRTVSGVAIPLSPSGERAGPSPAVAGFGRAGGVRGPAQPTTGEVWEDRAFSVMAGGDYALIKSVEGFEDFAAFGNKQLGDLGVSSKDVVFAITEGGETSFVIGTVWKGVEAGAKVYFVYNNPDDVLRQHVDRSREVIEDRRIEKINLTTGPMAITGSTRMQATTVQLCVLLTVLEMVANDLLNDGRADSETVPTRFLASLTEMHATLRSAELRTQLARLVALEESVYRAGHRNNYFADSFGIDVLTDTTERSPTYCTPPFRKFDDTTASESWSFLFLRHAGTAEAWRHILKREPRCVEWSEDEVRALVGDDKAAGVIETVRRISRRELMRFAIGLDGLEHRRLERGDSAIGIVAGDETEAVLAIDGFYRVQLERERNAGARIGLVCFGGASSLRRIEQCLARRRERARSFAPQASPQSHASLTHTEEPATEDVSVLVRVPAADFLLNGVTRVGVKMLLNALSTCTMVRLGRVMGNTMIWVVPSNLKLIDRATRYIERLTGLTYAAANRLLFEVIEYVEPRMKADQAYPPVVGLAVLRARHKLSNEEAEQRLNVERSA